MNQSEVRSENVQPPEAGVTDYKRETDALRKPVSISFGKAGLQLLAVSMMLFISESVVGDRIMGWSFVNGIILVATGLVFSPALFVADFIILRLLRKNSSFRKLVLGIATIGFAIAIWIGVRPG